ncbi:MAG TPA: hypothetical protein VLA15_01860, partial [Desulfurivibrionaceae bacterium]|nr:hypothetical protein [Desulfurivibrionaceae bacterium]
MIIDPLNGMAQIAASGKRQGYSRSAARDKVSALSQISGQVIFLRGTSPAVDFQAGCGWPFTF